MSCNEPPPQYSIAIHNLSRLVGCEGVRVCMCVCACEIVCELMCVHRFHNTGHVHCKFSVCTLYCTPYTIECKSIYYLLRRKITTKLSHYYTITKNMYTYMYMYVHMHVCTRVHCTWHADVRASTEYMYLCDEM